MKKAILLLMILLAAVMLCICASAEADPLFIAQEGGKQGFINKAGEWVVQPEYACVWPFTDAGYASVEENPWRGAFRLIDRQGNIVADLPDWYMDTNWGTDDLFHDFDLQNAAGTAFLLQSMADRDLNALYIAGADKLIKLDQAFLGYSLSPGAEVNAAYYTNSSLDRIFPWRFILAEWNDRIILAYQYSDYVWDKDKEKRYDCFIILDRQGNKLHDGCFYGDPAELWEERTTRDIKITDSLMVVYRESGAGGGELIDSNMQVVMNELPLNAYWHEALQAVVCNGQITLLSGEQITDDEGLKRRAEMNSCGLVMYGYKYYDTQGEPVEWPGLQEYTALSDFSREGLAWISSEYGDGDGTFLINAQGEIVAGPVYPSWGFGYSLFPEGWECVISEDWSGYGYLNPAGELMYNGLVFNNAEPFKDGLARVKYMDESQNLLDAYIDTDGRVVWAENGRKKEVQRWLNENIRHSVGDMTLETAKKKLVGEWDCTGGGEFIGYPIIFYENGTCDIGTNTLLKWDLVENQYGEDVFWNVPPFILIFGDEDGFEDPQAGLGLSFQSDEDGFSITDSEGGGGYIRVPEGYWEAGGYVQEPDENGKIDVWWTRETVLPKESPEFSLIDRNAPEGTENKGIYAFRGSPYRQNAAAGKIRAIGQPEFLWETDIGPAEITEDTTWQPLIAEWPEEIRKRMTSLHPEKQEMSGMSEVIATGTDGRIYFADLYTGEETRPALNGEEGKPYGTPVLSPGFPLLLVPSEDLGFTYDLTDCSRKTELDQLRAGGWRGNNILFQNGWLLSDDGRERLIHLIPRTDEDGMLKLSDVYETFYRNSSSMKEILSADGSIVYYAESSYVYRRDLMTDDQYVHYYDQCYIDGKIHSTVAIDHPDQGTAALYVGTGFDDGCVFRVNADTMKTEWGKSIALDKDNPYLGGAIASPVIGEKKLADLVYFTITGLAEEIWTDDGKGREAALFALDKENGEMRWALWMTARAVSSPVAVYTEEGKGYLIQIDRDGNMYVADGLTGELMYTYELGGTVTTSPAVYNNILTVRCQKEGREVLCGVQIGE